MQKKPLEWSKRAGLEVFRITEFYIEEASPLVGHDAAKAIENAGLAIQKNPLQYREGKKRGTREYIVRRFPYIVIYKVTAHKVFILRVLHQAKKYFN